MPTLTIPDIRTPDVRLPEITRDDVVRSISDIEVPEAVKNLSMPSFRRSPRPTRWPWLLGLAIAGVASWLVLTNDRVRARLSDAVGAVRAWMPDSWTGSRDPDAFHPDEPDERLAFGDAPITPSAYSGPSGDQADDLTGPGTRPAKVTPAKAATAAGRT